MVCGLGSLGQACLLRLLPFDCARCGASTAGRRTGANPRLEERLGARSGHGGHAPAPCAAAGGGGRRPGRAAAQFREHGEFRGGPAGAPAQSRRRDRGALLRPAGQPRRPAGATPPRSGGGGSPAAHRRRDHRGPPARRSGGHLRGRWPVLPGAREPWSRTDACSGPSA